MLWIALVAAVVPTMAIVALRPVIEFALDSVLSICLRGEDGFIANIQQEISIVR